MDHGADEGVPAAGRATPPRLRNRLPQLRVPVWRLFLGLAKPAHRTLRILYVAAEAVEFWVVLIRTSVEHRGERRLPVVKACDCRSTRRFGIGNAAIDVEAAKN